MRRVNEIGENGRPKNKYAVEIRQIAADCSIESRVLEPRFNSQQEAMDYAVSQGYTITTTWVDAERQQDVYRDGNLGVYRDRPIYNSLSSSTTTANNTSQPTDTSDAEDQAWQETLAKMESAKAKRVNRIDLV